MIYGIDMLDGLDMTSLKYNTGGSAVSHWSTMAGITT